jgi:transcriptional regulator with XRE-family HTH domain
MFTKLTFKQRLFLIQGVLKSKGITQKDLALELGLSQPMISNILNGELIPEIKVLLTIMKYLDIPIENVFPEFVTNFAKVYQSSQGQGSNEEILSGLIQLIDLKRHYTEIDDDITPQATKHKNRV